LINLTLSSNNSLECVRPSDYGTAGPSATAAQNTTAIQAAITAAAAATRATAVLIDTPGTWLVNKSATPTRCFQLAAGSVVLIAPGVTIKLANNQTTDANPTVIFHQPATATSVYIGWPWGMGGTLDGNTSNQSGWTLGYGQSIGSYLISADDVFNGLTVEGLYLANCFSNPINAGGANVYGTSDNFTVRNLVCTNFGEGVQAIGVDNCYAENIDHIISTNWAGDCLEFSHCRYGFITNCKSRTLTDTVIAEGGSGFDLYGSKDFEVDGFYISGVTYPWQVETNFSDTTKVPDRIKIRNVNCRSATAWIVQSGGSVDVSDCLVNVTGSGGSGPQLRNDATDGTPAIYSFSNCRFIGKAATGVTGNGVTLRMNGVVIDDSSSAPNAALTVVGNVILDVNDLLLKTTATVPAIAFQSSTPTGRMIAVDASGVITAGYPVTTSGTVSLAGLVLQFNSDAINSTGAPANSLGARELHPNVTVTSANLSKGSHGQTLIVRAVYGATITGGARIKLLNADASVTLATSVYNYSQLTYNSDNDVWYETQRVVT